MTLVIILDLTHLIAWEDLALMWKNKYYLPSGNNFVVVCNLTDGIWRQMSRHRSGLIAALCFCWCYTWMDEFSFEMLSLFWLGVMCLLSSIHKIEFYVELLADNVWKAEDDKTCFLSFGVDIFDWLILINGQFPWP